MDTTMRPHASLSRLDLNEVLDTLDPVGRDLFDLRVFQGLSPSEIADLGFHGMTSSEVRKTFSKTVEVLRKTPAIQDLLQEPLIQQACG